LQSGFLLLRFPGGYLNLFVQDFQIIRCRIHIMWRLLTVLLTQRLSFRMQSKLSLQPFLGYHFSILHLCHAQKALFLIFHVEPAEEHGVEQTHHPVHQQPSKELGRVSHVLKIWTDRNSNKPSISRWISFLDVARSITVSKTERCPAPAAVFTAVELPSAAPGLSSLVEVC